MNVFAPMSVPLQSIFCLSLFALMVKYFNDFVAICPVKVTPESC